MAKTYNLFISHSWNYGVHYDNLTALLDRASRFEYRNYSVPEDDPVQSRTDKELREALLNQMRPCHVVVILAGVYASYSKWIQIEIDLAQSGFLTSKPILAVKPRGNTRVSKAVRDAADEIVSWSTTSIVAAIRRLG